MEQENDEKFDGEGDDAALTNQIMAEMLKVEASEKAAETQASEKGAETQGSEKPTEAAKPAEVEATKPPEKAEQGEATKTEGRGKVKMVPHGALHEERERRRAAEAHAQKLAEELAQIKAPAPTERSEVSKEPTDAFMSEEDLQALEAESPVIAKTIRAQQDVLTKMRDRLAQTAAVVEVTAREQQERIQATVAEAIAATPEIAHALELHKKGDSEAWERMKAIDAELKASAYWRSMSTADRYAKVAREYADRYGEMELPATDTKEPTVDEVAEAKVKAAKAKASVAPKTLSDLPAGILPDGDRNQGLKSLSIRGMHNRLQEMDADKIDELISTL